MPAVLIQEADAAATSVTLGSGTTAGNTVIVAVACLGSTQATGVTGVTLGGSPDNFTPIAPGPSAHDTTYPNSYLNVSVWADANCAAGGTAVAVTGTGVVATWAYEFSGLAGTADISKVFSVSTYQDSWLATTVPAALPAEAWVAVIAAANQAGSETVNVTSGEGWTTETAYNGTSGSYYWGAVSAYQTVNTVGTPSFNGNFSQPSFSTAAIVTLATGTPAAPVAANAPLTGNVIVQGNLAVGGTLTAGGAQPGQPGLPSLATVQPVDAGFAAWSYDQTVFTSTASQSLGTAGDIHLIKCPVRATTACTGIRIWIVNAGLSLTVGENFAGVYSSAGNLIGTSADQSGQWVSTGAADALTTGGPFTISPPFAWVALLWNGSSAPSALATGSVFSSATWGNGKLAPRRARFGVVSGSYTSLPATFPLSAITLAGTQYWAALF